MEGTDSKCKQEEWRDTGHIWRWERGKGTTYEYQGSGRQGQRVNVWVGGGGLKWVEEGERWCWKGSGSRGRGMGREREMGRMILRGGMRNPDMRVKRDEMSKGSGKIG